MVLNNIVLIKCHLWFSSDMDCFTDEFSDSNSDISVELSHNDISEVSSDFLSHINILLLQENTNISAPVRI